LRGKRTYTPRQEEPYKVNSKIRAREVRVVGDFVEGGNAVMATDKAVALAEDNGLDLVEISPSASPPVCKVIDYAKFKYEQKKKQKEIKSNAAKTVVKEIRFGPNTDDHDFDFKAKHAYKFLQDGNKVKCYVQFKGRAIMFKDRGELLLLKFAERLAEVGSLESMPKMEGRRMIAIFTPKKK
jgi:translation initiation factor IF-3